MIHCPRCAARSKVVATTDHPALHLTANLRECAVGHQFSTREVHPTMLSDEREMRSARQAINRRIALYNRDKAIALDKRSTAEIAEYYGITVTRVRQIRAVVQPKKRVQKSRKIRPTTQKG